MGSAIALSPARSGVEQPERGAQVVSATATLLRVRTLWSRWIAMVPTGLPDRSAIDLMSGDPVHEDDVEVATGARSPRP